MADEEHEFFDDEVLDEDLDEEVEGDLLEEVEVEDGVEDDDEITDIEMPPAADLKITTIVKPDDRISSNVLFITEYVRVIGKRAASIEQGDDYFVSEGENALAIAEEEVKQGVSPIIVRRHLETDSGIRCENWKIEEMIIIN